jgi:DNA recombination protein RmuC
LADEGTYDFALMYIPAENVYYETIIKDGSEEERNLSQYALSKGVIPVSPNSLYAYLQAIVLRLKGLKVEERAKEIIQYLSRLRGRLREISGRFWLAGETSGVCSVQLSNYRETFGAVRPGTSFCRCEPRLRRIWHTIARWDSRLIRKQRGFLLCG